MKQEHQELVRALTGLNGAITDTLKALNGDSTLIHKFGICPITDAYEEWYSKNSVEIYRLATANLKFAIEFAYFAGRAHSAKTDK